MTTKREMKKEEICEYCEDTGQIYLDPKGEEDVYNPKWVPCICQLGDEQ